MECSLGQTVVGSLVVTTNAWFETNWLVVSIPLKNMKVSWDDYSQYMEK